MTSRSSAGIPYSERPGLALLAIAVIFTAWFAAPEARIDRLPLNDLSFHIAASERMETSFERGEPFLDPWVSEWALGYPVWRSYQPLPHVAAAILIHMFRSLAPPENTFAAFYFFLLVTFPVSVYIGARLLGLSPPAAGLAALLVFAPSSAGTLSGYDLGYSAYLWRGIGLYTQLFAMHLMAISIGVTARALDDGKRHQRILAGVFLALTAISHIIFGYAAFASAVLLAVVGPAGRVRLRLIRLGTIAIPSLLLFAWFVIPLALAKEIVNHSRWEFSWKWDSFGAKTILTELFSGRLLDNGRLPFLTILVAAGLGGAFLFRADHLARRLLTLTGVWLVLFFGRETWGAFTILAGIPADLPLHRLQGVFELSAVLLASYGALRLIEWLMKRDRTLGWLAIAAVVVAVGLSGDERARFLNANAQWGEDNLANWVKEGPDAEAAVADVQAILAERPGRASAGLAATWGNKFRVGAFPFYALLTRAHIDEASFLFHSMSKTSEVVVTRDENSAAQDLAFGIRAVVAPVEQIMSGNLRLHSSHGRFAVYEASREGYFGVVQVAGHFTGTTPGAEFDLNTAWLRSSLVPAMQVIALDPSRRTGPAIRPGDALPLPAIEQTGSGQVISETKTGEIYKAVIEANRPAWAYVKITWNPDLVATVDGAPSPLIRVTPGFGAVAIPAGRHSVMVVYDPGPLKSLLFSGGIGAFCLLWYFTGTAHLAKMEAEAPK